MKHKTPDSSIETAALCSAVASMGLAGPVLHAASLLLTSLNNGCELFACEIAET
jgi:hypothetical protein